MSHKYCVKFKHWTKVKKINKYDFVFAIFVVCFPFALDVILRVSKSLVRNTKKCSKNSKKKKHTSLQNIARFARYLKIYICFLNTHLTLYRILCIIRSNDIICFAHFNETEIITKELIIPKTATNSYS